MSEQTALIREDIISFISDSVEAGYDIQTIAAGMMVIALNIYKQTLSEQEFTELMTAIYSNRITSDNRVLH